MSDSEDDYDGFECDEQQREIARAVNKKCVIYQFSLPSEIKDTLYFGDSLIDHMYRALLIEHISMEDINITYLDNNMCHLTFKSRYNGNTSIPEVEQDKFTNRNVYLEYIRDHPFPLTLEHHGMDIDGTIHNVIFTFIKYSN